MGKPYYEFDVDREEAARYGMTTMMVNQIVSAGLGGVDVTTTVEGRERYPDPDSLPARRPRAGSTSLRKVSVVTHDGRSRAAGATGRRRRRPGDPARSTAKTLGWSPTSSFSPSGGAGDLETVEAVMDSLRIGSRERRAGVSRRATSSCRRSARFRTRSKPIGA